MLQANATFEPKGGIENISRRVIVVSGGIAENQMRLAGGTCRLYHRHVVFIF